MTTDPPSGLDSPPRASQYERDLTLVQVTEAAALAAHAWVGRGDKNSGDPAAVTAMRDALAQLPIDGIVVIGEGEKDQAPMLSKGERVGTGTGPGIDVAVDPVDGTTLPAQGMPNAIAVLAASERGTMFDPSAVVYMDKIVTSRAAGAVVDLDAPVRDNIAAVAGAPGCDPRDVTVCLLHRTRHEGLIRQVHQAGARVRLLADGDVLGAVMAAMDGGPAALTGGGGPTSRRRESQTVPSWTGSTRTRHAPDQQPGSPHGPDHHPPTPERARPLMWSKLLTGVQ